MTRDEMLELGMKKVKSMRWRLLYRSRMDEAMVEDCSQEALLTLIENYYQINLNIEGGADPVNAVYRAMWSAASRYLYRNLVAVSKVKSLDAPLTKDSDEPLTLGDMIVYRGDPSQDVERRTNARRAAKAMEESLNGEELGILMAFADEVPLEEISQECGKSPIEVLTIKKKASEKVQSSMFSAVKEKLLLAAITNPKSAAAKLVLEKVSP